MFLSFHTSYMAGNRVYITPNQNVAVGNRTKILYEHSTCLLGPHQLAISLLAVAGCWRSDIQCFIMCHSASLGPYIRIQPCYNPL